MFLSWPYGIFHFRNEKVIAYVNIEIRCSSFACIESLMMKLRFIERKGKTMNGGTGAAFWGLVSGSALLLGALIGYFARLPTRVIASIMAFGSGILISALSIDLTQDA